MQAMLMPRTWWQHLKLALRERWPRMFGRLIVQWGPAHKVDVSPTTRGAQLRIVKDEAN